MPPLLAQGWTCLVPSYRNDEGVPAGPDGRYALGLSEWRDVEAAIALRRRARRSGGAAHGVVDGRRDRAAAARPLAAVDAWSRGSCSTRPVIDWGDVLAHHAREHRVPRAVGSLARAMMRRPLGAPARRACTRASTWPGPTGCAGAHELHHPILLIHSADDEFVPCGPSRELARERPDLVTFEQWHVARHCKEWNTEPERWERLVGDFAAG